MPHFPIFMGHGAWGILKVKNQKVKFTVCQRAICKMVYCLLMDKLNLCGGQFSDRSGRLFEHGRVDGYK
jgi:hypothetical protein